SMLLETPPPVLASNLHPIGAVDYGCSSSPTQVGVFSDPTGSRQRSHGDSAPANPPSSPESPHPPVPVPHRSGILRRRLLRCCPSPLQPIAFPLRRAEQSRPPGSGGQPRACGADQ